MANNWTDIKIQTLPLPDPKLEEHLGDACQVAFDVDYIMIATVTQPDRIILVFQKTA